LYQLIIKQKTTMKKVVLIKIILTYNANIVWTLPTLDYFDVIHWDGFANSTWGYSELHSLTEEQLTNLLMLL